ncbi:centrosomal protein of 170 kDa protein B isoform X2 [Rhinatrema bivittatum]|uniref:centrosomal protein of 170 kDa protein B isoform X2 n=1 Tax=Rhinatrema bivittatum TaxID=194408 RepID=UPI00112C0ABF|nr:centrosomal protein of 170 kDa protein B isoform X2 [Rhinatrema bivittatum]
MSVTSWFLVSGSGTRHRLPREMIFVGREDCELILQSRSVDKQHAVINYDIDKDEHRVKDLGSLNGTFVNDVRIPDQKYITLKLSDVIRFGYDANMYVLEQIHHKVPEEALKHEKYTSQLQMSLKGTGTKRAEPALEPGAYESSQGKLEKGERKATTEPTAYRTPLYGQPSWWGDDDGNKQERPEDRRSEEHYSERTKEMTHHDEINGNITGYRDSQEQSVYSFRREPSYFEIPTKEFQQPPKSSEAQVHEIPTKDTDTATPPVMQSHASFTIEFDDCRPGKIKIKDHVTKFSLRQRRPMGKDPGTTEMISAESKVADWLVQNDPSLMRRPSPHEDMYSTKSDLPVHIRTLKGNRHEDGTQSDSEDPVLPAATKETALSEHTAEQARLQRQIRRDPQDMLHNQQAFVIEFFDDEAPRKKRSQSFTHTVHSSQSDTDPTLKTKQDRRKGAIPPEKPSSMALLPSVPTQVSKPASSSSGPQRSSSFRREKTDDRLSSSSSSTSRTSGKNYGSVGRKSKIAQEFAAEYFRERTEAVNQSAEVVPALPVPASVQTVTASQSIVSSALTTSLQDSKPTQVQKNAEEDSLSDAGTYTIETEAPEKEVEEARKMIDQVFGVLESEEFSRMSSGAFRPVIKGEKEEPSAQQRQPHENGLSQKTALLQAYPTSSTSSPQTDVQTRLAGPVTQSGQKWVSRWASLADSYTDSGPVSILYDLEQQGLVPEGVGTGHKMIPGEAETILPSRTRRLLPQLPPNDKSESPVPTVLISQESYSDAAEKSMIRQREKETYADPTGQLLVQEDLDPDSLSDASKSDDGLGIEKVGQHKESSIVPEQEWRARKDLEPDRRLHDVQEASKNASKPKSTSFYVGKENDETGSSFKESFSLLRTQENKEYKNQEFQVKSASGRQSAQDIDTAFLGNTEKAISSLQGLPRDRGSITPKEPSSFVRQESFTKDKSSSSVSHHKLPHISSHPLLRDLDVAKSNHMDYSHETHLFLKDTETALAALEAKILSQAPHLDPSENISCPQDDSLSGDSDVDTASSVSMVSSKNIPSHAHKCRLVRNLQKEKSSSTPSIQDQYGQPSARDRLSEKRKTLPSEAGSRADATKRFQLKRSTGPRGSLDFTDDERSSSLPYLPVAETASSDYEQSAPRPLSRRKLFTQSTKDYARNASNAEKVQQALTRSNSLSTPRPTRASKLRRARLGEASDNECADPEKVTLNSEGSTGNSSSSKQPVEVKKLSRLDILAMPRKRTGSFTVPSDSETASSRTGFSVRSVETSYSNRKPLMPEVKSTIRKPMTSTPKQPLSRARPGSIKYSSSSTSRRRHQGSDYTSTSEEEYGSNHSTPKHKRSHTSTATQTPRMHASSSHRQKHSAEDEGEDDEPDAYRNLMAQTAEIAEIARLSQTLVKDVAILAREIHDVAGDGDSQSSSGTGPSTSLSSIPNTPASTISAREELVQHIPEAGLNYQKVPPGSAGLKDFDHNMNSSREEDLSRRRTRNREEVIFDNLMLNPVSQLSHSIRANTESLAEKMKILFQNKEKTWEEVEAKINSENEVPILKTSNKEISSILKELRRVQKQLEVINAVIDPMGNLDAVANKKPLMTSLQPTVTKIRTANFAASPVDSQPPVRNYSRKPNCSPSSREANFVPDDEESCMV